MMGLGRFAMSIQVVLPSAQQQGLLYWMPRSAGGFACPFALGSLFLLAWCCDTLARDVAKPEDLWSLKRIVRPEIPQGVTSSPNPIDAFIMEVCCEKGLSPLGPSDKLVWLRRVSVDLIGLPPSIEEQEAFLADDSADATGKVVDRLLGSEQHGVRYGRHWLDVLRYADVDENMPAAPGIHLWRDWVISALNNDLPY